jgi:hypothetical protein
MSKEILSICIPCISETIPRTKIFQTFCKLKWGHIDKIVEIPLKNDIHSKRAIIRIKWSNHPEAIAVKELFKTGATLNIVYDLPWYWRASLYTTQPAQYQPIIYKKIEEQPVQIPPTIEDVQNRTTPIPTDATSPSSDPAI